ncbi:MAG: hypothetical protein FIB06_06490 [Betaproteobacteria bacterium]|nr:hypothetical protein [Betaproteobacteria bacterium]
MDQKEKITQAYKEIRKQPPWHQPSTPNIQHHRVLPHATYSPWLSDSDFLEIFHAIESSTLVDIYRCYELWQLAAQSLQVEGDILEVGVWRGGTGALIAHAVRNSQKQVFLADTFSGVVKACERDPVYQGGEHSDTSLDLVNGLIKTLRLRNTSILKGIFPDETANKIPGKLALVHCDVDVYTSAKEVFDWSAPRLSGGGAIVFDDYGFSTCEGVTTFVNEIRSAPGFTFIHNLNGHAILIKK